MPSAIDELIARAGLDPHHVTLEQMFELVREWADLCAGYAMAEVKLGKGRHLITRDEAWAALDDGVTVGDEALTGKTLRAGEDAHNAVLWGHGLYNEKLARLRADTNRDLNQGEITVMGKPWPTNKRPSGRPGGSKRFAKYAAILVYFTVGSGEASSVERAVALLTGRDRDGRKVGGGPPRLALPNSKSSHWFVHEQLRWVAANMPDLIEDARRQGEIARTGGVLDERCSKELREVSDILGNRQAVDRLLRAAKR